MLGFEFAEQTHSEVDAYRAVAEQGFFGYAVAGYLLRAHRIRTFPTASALNTLRFEPSVLLADEAIDRLEVALRDVCGLLRAGDPRLVSN
ncbi:hypothetical protein [Streptomyces lonarensis]|uniref:hypothetical protein n=1 Tax=Streptomyces lonarensis TaxID=700599 RepID=UPI001FD73258|nr:hypothetical protein [Streptomyces lonarensis]